MTAWAFGRHDTDTTNSVWTAAYGPTAVAGQWTHLVGIYDNTADQISLYVNGRLAAIHTFTTPWNATGPLQIGRRLSAGTYGEYANAQINDVRIYNTALPTTDAAAPADNPNLTQLD